MSSTRVDQLPPGTAVTLFELASSDGHTRARIGDDRWLSLQTAAGNVLLIPDEPTEFPASYTVSESTFVPECFGLLEV